MTSRLIGICGNMRTGKDSVASLLTENGYERHAFADALREMAVGVNPYIIVLDAEEDILDEIREHTNPFLLNSDADADVIVVGGAVVAVKYLELLRVIGYERAKSIPDFRRFLQHLGTDGVRNVLGQSTWVDVAIVRATTTLRDGGSVVFSDVRFPNEADAITQLGGEVWRTVRPGYGGSGHISETALEEIVPDIVLEAEDLDGLAAVTYAALGIPSNPEQVALWKKEILG